MSSLQRQEGYLLIDERAAGGLKYESATATCCHCQSIVILNPQRTRARGFCSKCNGYTCDNPACNVECRPFWEMIDKELTRIINKTP